MFHLQQETWLLLTIPGTKEIKLSLWDHKYFKIFSWMAVFEASIFSVKEQKTPRLLKPWFYRLHENAAVETRFHQLRLKVPKSDRICWNYGPSRTLLNYSLLIRKGPQGLFHLTRTIVELQGKLELRKKQNKTKQDWALNFTFWISTCIYSSLRIFFSTLCPSGFSATSIFPLLLKHMQFSLFLYSGIIYLKYDRRK